MTAGAGGPACWGPEEVPAVCQFPVPASPASRFGPAAKTDHSDAQLLYCAGALWQISLRAAFRRDWVGSYKVVVLGGGGGGAGTCTR